jgi:hypothetical protein
LARRRWVLKSPDHVYGLESLLTVFPDAAIIQTHRNPLDVLKSQIRLTQVLEAMYARPVARDELGRSEARKLKGISDYITRFRDAHTEVAENFINVNYRSGHRDDVELDHAFANAGGVFCCHGCSHPHAECAYLRITAAASCFEVERPDDDIE